MKTKITLTPDDVIGLIGHYQGFVRCDAEWEAFDSVIKTIKEMNSIDYPLPDINITLNNYERKKTIKKR